MQASLGKIKDTGNRLRAQLSLAPKHPNVSIGDEPSRILGIGLQTKTLNALFTDKKVSS